MKIGRSPYYGDLPIFMFHAVLRWNMKYEHIWISPDELGGHYGRYGLWDYGRTMAVLWPHYSSQIHLVTFHSGWYFIGSMLLAPFHISVSYYTTLKYAIWTDLELELEHKFCHVNMAATMAYIFICWNSYITGSARVSYSDPIHTSYSTVWRPSCMFADRIHNMKIWIRQIM